MHTLILTLFQADYIISNLPNCTIHNIRQQFLVVGSVWVSRALPVSVIETLLASDNGYKVRPRIFVLFYILTTS